MPPALHAARTAWITNFTAASVDRSFLFPNCPSGNRPWASAASDRRSGIMRSRTFPIQLSSAIGRYAPGVSFWAAVFPGFGRIATLAWRNAAGQCPRRRHASKRVARQAAAGLPQARRKPAGSPSGPAAFQGFASSRAANKSPSVMSWLRGTVVRGGAAWFIIRGLAPTWGKNRFASMPALSLVLVNKGPPAGGRKGVIFGGRRKVRPKASPAFEVPKFRRDILGLVDSAPPNGPRLSR